MKAKFDRFCRRTASLMGHPAAFILALVLIVAWLISGIHFGYTNELYQLAVNSATTVVTFLMVFLIQNSQNRDTQAMHLKLDELVRVIDDARDDVAGVEEKTEAEIAELKTPPVTPRAVSGIGKSSGHD